ncbi:MAG: heme NO-binding domain-containing protein [Acidimicrobiales bacterium]
MKGILFNLAEEVVTEAYGPEMWDELLRTSHVDGAYTSLGNYPDAEFTSLVAAAVIVMELPEAEIVRFIGAGAIPLLAQRFPEFFDPYHSTEAFVLTLNEIIHPEVRKLYPGADVPEFEFDHDAQGHLLVNYRSARKLCSLADGFIQGSAGYFGERVSVDHVWCMHRGDDNCQLRCSFGPAA